MLLPAACSTICKWLRGAVGLACATLFLLLATHTKTSASTLPQPDPAPVIPVSAPASLPAPGELDSDDAPPGARGKQIQLGKTTFTNTTSSHAGTLPAPATPPPAGEPPSLGTGNGNGAPDWHGVWRDTGILFGSQIGAAGVIYLMPESVSGWSDEQKDSTFHDYSKNVGHPEWDSDDFYINYILHPYWGATYYIRGRERGLDQTPAFIYSALISAMYEFGVESFFENPSIQDLIVTPIAGSLLGAYIFEPLRESIKRKQELRWYDDALLILTDPVGVLSAGVEKLFGLKPSVRISYSVSQPQRLSGSVTEPKSDRISALLQFPLN